MTEFLPVSSSAHLVIFQEILKIQENQILFDITLHLGTLLAIVVFLFKELKQLVKTKVLLYVFLSAVATAVIVILGKDFFENMFSSAKNCSLPLLITGLVLLATKKFMHGERRLPNLKITDGLWLGVVQGFAVIPGLSRSGVTISTLLFRGVERETAFKFSFLASILAILGALFFKISDFSQLSFLEFRPMIFGFSASFFSGLLALKILLIFLRQARLYLFGYYCLVLALVVWIF